MTILESIDNHFTPIRATILIIILVLLTIDILVIAYSKKKGLKLSSKYYEYHLQAKFFSSPLFKYLLWLLLFWQVNISNTMKTTFVLGTSLYIFAFIELIVGFSRYYFRGQSND
jgi:hypothetical protein